MLEDERLEIAELRSELKTAADEAERLTAALERLGVRHAPIVLSPEGEAMLQRMRVKVPPKVAQPKAPATARGRLFAVKRNAS